MFYKGFQGIVRMLKENVGRNTALVILGNTNGQEWLSVILYITRPTTHENHGNVALNFISEWWI